MFLVMGALRCVNLEAGEVWYLHFSEVRYYVVGKTSLIEIYIGIVIICLKTSY
jgi:hypothetical protein